MHKYNFLLAVLIVFTVFSISAQEYHQGYGHTPYYGDNRFNIKEYSGKLKLDGGELPEIKSGKDDIQLLIPVETVDELELTDGKEIRVEGIEYRKRFFVFKGKHVLMVNEIETGGNTYFVSKNTPIGGFGRGSSRSCW